MRKLIPSAALAVVCIVAVSCSDTVMPTNVTAPQFSGSGTMPELRFSEIHYDNSGTDAGERIEISGPAGMSVDGYQVILYNGSGGASYHTATLSGTIPATCGDRGVIVLSYASNGIQNGSPDGMALVAPGNSVIEFLSWEGTFTATNGSANGLVSTDIGAAQNGTEQTGSSIERDAANNWTARNGSNSFGQCNDNGPVTPVVTVTVSPSTATLSPGQTQQFSATAFDANGTSVPSTFTWSSDAATIASVDANGLVTGHGQGDATITARSANGVTGTAAVHVNAPPVVSGIIRISELHYDNVGTDVGEAVEIEGPAGADLAGWRLVLYNGNGGAVYHTRILSGVIPATCGTRGVITFDYPSGIQNGSPDGITLVAPNDSVAEFWAYEGAMTAVGGPADGMAASVMPVDEAPDNSVAIGNSLQRDSAGNWYGPHAASFGACNTPPPPPATAIVISEMMADPLNASGGASWGEWFEVHNYGTTAVDLNGWTIASAGGASQPPHVISRSVIVPAGGYIVLGRGDDATRNGGITLDYNYFSGGSTTIFLDATDYIVLRDANGVRVDSVRWTSSSTMVKGTTRALRSAATENANVDGPNWGYSTTQFGHGDYGTPGSANGMLADTPPVVPNSIVFSGRVPSDPALPVGFEDQLFANLRDGQGNTVPTTITWEALTPSIATIDANGVLHAHAVGTATVRATASDGTTATYSLPTRVATASTTAQYDGNAEFGEPVDADASDDFIVRYAQYTASFNPNRGTPNWVSYNIDATHFGPEDRCDCFTFDPSLPSAFTRYTTADYTGAGTFHGYGIDRGHLARSFDRTAGSLDNAVSFYFTNIIPQAADQNQGPWAALETYLGDLARLDNREVYVIAGVAGNKGTVKNEGRIVIPAHTWKVAVIMPRNQRLADVVDHGSVTVIAVIMPNEPGVRNVNWQTYATTVDEVETLSGYDLLALLPDPIEIAVESNTVPPVAAVDGPYTANEGAALAMSAATSTDQDGDALTFTWTFGDGQSANGTSISHTYAQDGTYLIRLIATDPRGLADTVTTTATVANVAPALSAISGATLLPGETYTATGSFTDPGADVWTGSVNYGDGSGSSVLVLNGKGFALSHRYNTSGSYTVTVAVSDGVSAGSATAIVTVLTQVQGVQLLMAMVNQLAADGVLNAGNTNALTSKLDAATNQLELGNFATAANQLNAFGNQLDAFLQSGRLSGNQHAALKAELQRIQASLSV